MHNGISSYLSIFDDWNLLKPSLWSIADRVDEIVVVDGAYKWMTPALEALGRDPKRSRTEVYDILASFGTKIRVINGTWENETQKRQAGYDACSNRYILRHDSDEIVFWNDAGLNDFLTSDFAVGQMEMPLYVSPLLIRAASQDSAIERQTFIFDSKKINAYEHLSYLWLVLPPEEREKMVPVKADVICRNPVAYTAHLTHWRSPETAISRARFYVLNYIRANKKLPWLPNFVYNDEKDFEVLFQFVSPDDFNDILLGDPIVASPVNTKDMTIRRSPRSLSDERSFALLYDQMISGLAHVNDDLVHRPRAMVNGGHYHIDASVERSLINLQRKGFITMQSDQLLNRASVRFIHLFSDGHVDEQDVLVDIDGDRFSFGVPSLQSFQDGQLIRRTLRIAVASESKRRVLRLKALP